MPKAKAKSQKKAQLPEDELSELLQKSLKKTAEQEETGVEEGLDEKEKELDKNINIESLEFHQFMNLETGEAGSPVLERIAGSQVPRPIFVGGILQGTSTAANAPESGDDFKYMPGGETRNEPKYLGPPEAMRGTAERVRFEDVGRKQEFFPQINQESFVEGASEARIFSQPSSMERFERAERFEIEKAGRRDVFERLEAKYEKYRPKLPSGR